jgi:hypothetical protein
MSHRAAEYNGAEQSLCGAACLRAQALIRKSLQMRRKVLHLQVYSSTWYDVRCRLTWTLCVICILAVAATVPTDAEAASPQHPMLCSRCSTEASACNETAAQQCSQPPAYRQCVHRCCLCCRSCRVLHPSSV